MSERCVVMFTKPARPGRVKTRLIGALTAAEAAELHAAFVADMADKLRTGAFDLHVAWALDDGEAVPSEPPLPASRQRGADLGARLFHGLRRVAGDYAYVAAIGSDHPEIEGAELESAFRRLEGGCDAVLGPVADGGYYLIALRAERLHRRLFEGIRWSSDSVLRATRSRCRELGLRVEELAAGSDVDRPEDLDRLRERLRREPHLAPHTARLLARWQQSDARAAER